jgi:drug/metabolite transporter (DMT)-like permease
VLAIVLGLGSGLLWGSADFFGGLEARRLSALSVALWGQAVGGTVLVAVVVGSGGSVPAGSLAWGAAAGVLGGLALVLFYRGLAGGTMSIVAPVSACGSLVPVLVALVRGDVPSTPALVGIAAALVGIVVVSLPSEGPGRQTDSARLSLLLAGGAALGFGSFYVLVERGAAIEGASSLAVVLGARCGSLPTLALLALTARQPAPFPGSRLAVVAAIGIGDTAANALFAHASTLGNLAVVAVLASLYPVATVVLARLVLDERVGPTQALGVVLALAGVALLAGG